MGKGPGVPQPVLRLTALWSPGSCTDQKPRNRITAENVSVSSPRSPKRNTCIFPCLPSDSYTHPLLHPSSRTAWVTRAFACHCPVDLKECLVGITRRNSEKTKAWGSQSSQRTSGPALPGLTSPEKFFHLLEPQYPLHTVGMRTLVLRTLVTI